MPHTSFVFANCLFSTALFVQLNKANFVFFHFFFFFYFSPPAPGRYYHSFQTETKFESVFSEILMCVAMPVHCNQLACSGGGIIPTLSLP